MYTHYYLNKIKHDGKYNEIHISKCSYMPDYENAEYLGYLSSYNDASKKAIELGYNPDGCAYCCSFNHHG